MRIKISTLVDQNHLEVKDGFTQELFLSLNPPLPKVKLLRFDGCKKNDQVSLELNFVFFKQVWNSLITEDETTDKVFRFIDEGTKLPFFLKYWRHHHKVLARENGSEIVDDITFKTPFILFDILMYPMMYGQFLYRKPIYKKIFKK